MPRRRKRGTRRPAEERDPIFKKTTTMDELLRIKKELEGGIGLVDEKLAGLAARQKEVEPLIRELQGQLDENGRARDQLDRDPNSRLLRGLFGLGHKAAAKKRLGELDEQRKQIEERLIAVFEKCDTGSRLWFIYRMHIEREFDFTTFWQSHRESVERDKRPIQERLKYVEVALERKRREAAENNRRAVQRAKLAALDGESRGLTSTVKNNLPHQEECPYCGGGLGTTPHADHIYPIALGGYSVVANLVLVCARCNLKKSSLTLQQFIFKFKLNREEVEARLRSLGKTF